MDRSTLTVQEIRIRFSKVSASGRIQSLADAVAVFEGPDLFPKNHSGLSEGSPERLCAELMRSLCRSVRASLHNPGSPLFQKKVDSPASRKVRDYMLSFFDDVLNMLESSGAVFDTAVAGDLLEEAETTIGCLMVEDRVCQS